MLISHTVALSTWGSLFFTPALQTEQTHIHRLVPCYYVHGQDWFSCVLCSDCSWIAGDLSDPPECTQCSQRGTISASFSSFVLCCGSKQRLIRPSLVLSDDIVLLEVAAKLQGSTNQNSRHESSTFYSDSSSGCRDILLTATNVNFMKSQWKSETMWTMSNT